MPSPTFSVGIEIHELRDICSGKRWGVSNGSRPRIMLIQPVIKGPIKEPAFKLKAIEVDLQIVMGIGNSIVVRIARTLQGSQKRR